MLSSIFRSSSFRRSTASTSLFSLLAVAVSTRTTFTESGPFSASKQNDRKESEDGGEAFSFGRKYYPQDVYYDHEVKEALEKLRLQKRKDLDAISVEIDKKKTIARSLKRSGSKYKGTLTLIGYKGGLLESQINQDRAVVVSPFWVGNEKEKQNQNAGRQSYSKLLGVFDGHARLGEVVSEYVAKELPKILASKLGNIPKDDPDGVKTAILDAFVEVDKKAPADISGGCTASIVLQRGSKLYVANAGDSRSFVIVYQSNNQITDVIYISREDKPNLKEERERIEKMGGKVFLPPLGTSRVLYTDPESGLVSGLAMSRSIGDWEVGKIGVIPDPIIDVIDIDQVVKDRLKNNADDVHIFAVSATDGLLDYTSPECIAKSLATSMYKEDGPHLLTALEQLIFLAASGWEKAKRGTYRDDISISVSEIRIPPGTHN